jgi:hypothetical protein
MISAEVSGGLLEGFKVGNANFSHLLFADDTLIFLNVRLSQLCYLRCLFLLFEAALGLMVNLAKPDLIPVGDADQEESLIGILGCGVATLPVKYLGLLLGASYKSIHKWDGFIEKIEQRFGQLEKVLPFQGR